MRRALIMGGNGNLGKAFVNCFKQRSNWQVMSIDFADNSEADSNLILSGDSKIQQQLPDLYDGIQNFSAEYDAILCAAGGFQVASIKDDDVLSKYLQIDKSCF